jgi:hypothetical protein
MKNQRAIVLAVSTALVLVIANVFNSTVSTSRFNESYPAAVCPPNTTGLTTAISLTSPKTQIRKTGTSSMQTSAVGFRRFAISSQSAVIEAGSVTPVQRCDFLTVVCWGNCRYHFKGLAQYCK